MFFVLTSYICITEKISIILLFNQGLRYFNITELPDKLSQVNVSYKTNPLIKPTT